MKKYVVRICDESFVVKQEFEKIEEALKYMKQMNDTFSINQMDLYEI